MPSESEANLAHRTDGEALERLLRGLCCPEHGMTPELESVERDGGRRWVGAAPCCEALEILVRERLREYGIY